MRGEEREAMELIEEYLSEVREHLPEDIADDVVEELRTHIIDESSELGGLTVRNVYKVIRKLGDPRELASKYVVGRKKKVLSFEFGISEDLYPYFVQISFWISILLIIGYAARIIYVIFRYSSATSLLYVPILLVELLFSIGITILLLYVVMSFFSSNPEFKSMLQDLLKDIFGEPKKAEKKRVKEKKTELETRRKEKPKIKETPRERRTKASGIKLTRVSAFDRAITLIAGIIYIIFAYALFISTFYLNYNWLSNNFITSTLIYLGASAIVSISHYFYMTYTDKKSYLVSVLDSLLGFIFIPWLIQVNIYTNELQIPYIDPEVFANENYSNILEHIELMPIPSNMILLAKMLSLLFIVIIVVDAIITILKYSRTSPKRKAEEILLGMHREEEVASINSLNQA